MNLNNNLFPGVDYAQKRLHFYTCLVFFPLSTGVHIALNVGWSVTTLTSRRWWKGSVSSAASLRKPCGFHLLTWNQIQYCKESWARLLLLRKRERLPATPVTPAEAPDSPLSVTTHWLQMTSYGAEEPSSRAQPTCRTRRKINCYFKPLHFGSGLLCSKKKVNSCPSMACRQVQIS